MPREGTKAAEIMRLYSHAIYTVREIAEIVGCRPEYVRVVARQRKGGGWSESDRRYLKKIYAQGDRDRARSAARAAYRAARLKGKSLREAYGCSGAAYAGEMVRTGRNVSNA